MPHQKIQCEFKNWSTEINVYSCRIKNKIISENAELEFIGKHKDGKTNQDVEAIAFDDCTISKIPQGLTKIFPKLNFLQILRSKLKSVENEDFKDYKTLTTISFPANEIHYLPGDLFAGMDNLEVIWLNNNKIEVIEPNLLDGLEKLKNLNLKGNLCIDKYFDLIKTHEHASLQDIKDEIREKYSRSPWKKIIDEKNRLSLEIIELKDTIATHNNGFCGDLKKVVENENFKDFTVQVGDEEFKVHKILLAARSPVLKEMIENNIDAEYLNLVDISKEIFREILNYIYTDELPKSDDINYLHLFAATGRLKIENLKNFAAIKLISKINAENAFEIMTLANKYESENLQQKSLEILKNEFDDCGDEITANLQLEKLKKLLSIKKEKEKLKREMELKIKEVELKFKEALKDD